MNRWASMLGDLPAGLQRAIARAQRISLPRRCTADERLRRLRQALCHATSVRAVYGTLSSEEQSALQQLRALSGGIARTELEQRYGPIRPASQFASAPRPTSLSERMMLLGWLLPRPVLPGRQQRFLLPPELRAWLPRSLPADEAQLAALQCLPQALRAAAALIALCSERPLPACADGKLRHSSNRVLAERLPATQAEATALSQFMLPLLAELGLLAQHANGWCATPLAARFLAFALTEQLERLREAWFRSTTDDAWMRPCVPDRVGLDRPQLRRRLWTWGAALLSSPLVESETLYDTLAAAFGPLSDSHTHGYRTVERAPWQRRRAAVVFQAALHGPLRWLGLVHEDTTTSAPHYVHQQLNLPAPNASPWYYREPGQICVPHHGVDASLLELLPFVQWQAADAEVSVYQVTPASLAAAHSAGIAESALWKLLARCCGPVAETWRAGLPARSLPVRIVGGVVVLADPDLLARASRDRSVRRHLGARLAPGVALIEPHAAAALVRALARRGIAAEQQGQPGTTLASELSASESATLLLSCTFYRRHAPAGAPLLPPSGVEERLRAALTPQLRVALDTALDQIDQVLDGGAAEQPGSADTPPAPLTPDQARLQLTRAIRRNQAVELIYDTGGQGAWSRRVVRPLAIEARGELWYLRAYCMLRQAERTFRIDRVGAVERVGR